MSLCICQRSVCMRWYFYNLYVLKMDNHINEVTLGEGGCCSSLDAIDNSSFTHFIVLLLLISCYHISHSLARRAGCDMMTRLPKRREIISSLGRDGQQFLEDNERNQHINHIIHTKVKKYPKPFLSLKIPYPATQKTFMMTVEEDPTTQQTFTAEEDRWLVCMMKELSYGAWNELKREVRLAPQFRFDWFLKSRTAIELSRRCDYLIEVLEREWDFENEQEQSRSGSKKPKGKRRSTPGNVSPSCAPTVKKAKRQGL